MKKSGRCYRDNQCSRNQCCVEEERFHIVSKRAVAKPHPFFIDTDFRGGNTICWHSLSISVFINVNGGYYCNSGANFNVKTFTIIKIHHDFLVSCCIKKQTGQLVYHVSNALLREQVAV